MNMQGSGEDDVEHEVEWECGDCLHTDTYTVVGLESDYPCTSCGETLWVQYDPYWSDWE